MHFTPAPGHLHPRETQPCPGSSCTRCPRRGTHQTPGPAPPCSRPSDQGWGGGGMQELIPPPPAPKTQGRGGHQALPSRLRHGDVPGCPETGGKNTTRRCHLGAVAPALPRCVEGAQGSHQAEVLHLTQGLCEQVRAALHQPHRQPVPRRRYFSLALFYPMPSPQTGSGSKPSCMPGAEHRLLPAPPVAARAESWKWAQRLPQIEKLLWNPRGGKLLKIHEGGILGKRRRSSEKPKNAGEPGTAR